MSDSGRLVDGSGFTTHNLSWFDPRAPADAAAPSPSVEFEHWASLFVSFGAGSMDNRSVVDGFWYGMSKRSWQFG